MLPESGGDPKPAVAAARGLLFLLLLTLAAVVAFSAIVRLRPDLPWLAASGDSQWVRPDEPMNLRARRAAQSVTQYRVSTDAAVDELTLRVLGTAAVYVDGERVARLSRSPRDWRQAETIRLPPSGTGPRTLQVLVLNWSGPGPLQVLGPPAIRTGVARWEGRFDEPNWSRAVSVEKPFATPQRRAFAPVNQSFLSLLPLLTVLLLLGWVGAHQLSSRPPPRWLEPSRLRYLGVGLVVGLGLNNFLQLPWDFGFDIGAHYVYLDSTAHQRLPAPNDGWQTFQGPLFYLLAGPWLALLRRFLTDQTALQGVRLLTVLASALQVELAYRAARLAFPLSAARQRLAILFAVGLGMNLYISQYPGNEPWAGLLGATLLVACLRLLRSPSRARWNWEPVGLGLLAGAAILTKVSNLVLAGPALLVLLWSSHRAGARLGASLKTGLVYTASLTLACGWFFHRNWLFTGRWLHTINLDEPWWQDPGFRTWSQMADFGESLRQPILASTHGIWDALYSTLWLDGSLSGSVGVAHAPPWNYDFLIVTAWLSLLPAVAILLGSTQALGRRPRSAPLPLFATGVALLFLAAILFVYLTLPIYTTGKATYLLSLTPLLAILFAHGLGPLATRPRLGPLVTAGALVWALVSVGSYWIL